MRLLRLTTVAFVISFALMWAAALLARNPHGLLAWAAEEEPEKNSRIERVVVIGQRLGNLRALLAGSTLRGTEGFVDGSAPEESDNRTAFPWQVYYAPDGQLEAHFRRIGARKPHGLMEELDYVEYGTWKIDEGELCQQIPKVGSGYTVCFELRRIGQTKIQMYYTRCGAMNRCYPGRLGPDGELFPGRSFTR